MKAWTFYRRSTDKQELSVSDQRRECQAFASARGWQIVQEFEPVKGWGSGLTIDQDASFLQMVSMAERGDHGISVLLVYDVSRFGRLGPETKIYWEGHFKRFGIQVTYVKDDFRNDGSTLDALSKVLKHSEAHEYSRKLSEVTLRGAKSHAALGHFTGGQAPYGYDRLLTDAAGQPVKRLRRGEYKADTTQRVILAPSPIEAPVLRWIFETYEQGAGLRKIIQTLNEQKTPAPRGRHWCKTQIHHMIRNRAYVGERVYNKRSYKAYRRGEKSSLNNPMSAWIVKVAAHEPLIDHALFDRVQRRILTRAVTIGRTQQRPYLLTGIALCQQCGYRLMGYPKAGNGHRYLTYTCSAYHRIGTSVCESFHIRAEFLEGAVVQTIRDFVADPGRKAMIRRIMDTLVREEYGTGAETRLDQLQDQLTDLNRQIANVVQAVKAGSFSEALNQTLGDLEKQRESVRSAIGEALGRANQKVGAEHLADKVMAYLDDFDRLWNQEATVEERKDLLRTFVRQVNVKAKDRTAEVWLWKIPQTQQTLGPEGYSPSIPRVYCGGRFSTLGIIPPPEVVPLVFPITITLPPAYAQAV